MTCGATSSANSGRRKLLWTINRLGAGARSKRDGARERMGIKTSVVRQYAGIVQWSNETLPRFRRGFDSRCPLQFLPLVSRRTAVPYKHFAPDRRCISVRHRAGGPLQTGYSSAWLECLVRNQEAAGSNPATPTNSWLRLWKERWFHKPDVVGPIPTAATKTCARGSNGKARPF